MKDKHPATAVDLKTALLWSFLWDSVRLHRCDPTRRKPQAKPSKRLSRWGRGRPLQPSAGALIGVSHSMVAWAKTC